MDDRVATRLYLPDKLAVGGAIQIGPGATHRLRHVLRLGIGGVIAAFNPRDGEFVCQIAESGRDTMTLAVRTILRPPVVETGPWLVFAPVKRPRTDWLIEKATELGVAALVPVLTARTQADRLNRERLASHAIAAAEQCERLSVPELQPPIRLDKLLAGWSPSRRLVVCDESGGGKPLAEAVAGLPRDSAAAVLIGPEGGFTQTELDALADLPFVTRAGLGPRILRAETAALGALAVFQAIAGDWRPTLSK
ncbi:MAG: 16S rRNA (uracil(1498)-N(3))-methyltransferase [Alphaproteobacteria bacterium]|nr:16S rRNA (uracil(1498)-N(3))-methyltransferase [Alphaproteobacteria bacterium]